MKKLLLTLGTVAAVAAPVASVVACGDTDGGTTGTTLQSTKTSTELNAIDLKQLENFEVSKLDSQFGITSGALVTDMVKEGITYAEGILTFKAGPLGEETEYVITVTPKAVAESVATQLVKTFEAKQRDAADDLKLSTYVDLKGDVKQALSTLLANSEKVGEQLQTRNSKPSYSDLTQTRVFFKATTPEAKDAMKVLLGVDGYTLPKDAERGAWSYDADTDEIKDADFFIVLYTDKMAAPGVWTKDGKALDPKTAVKSDFIGATFNGAVKDATDKGAFWLSKDATTNFNPINFF